MRVAGIEPATPTWKDGILPLNYTRLGFSLMRTRKPEIIDKVKYVKKMKKSENNYLHTTATTLPAIYLMGITARTNNAAEMDPKRAKIGSMMQRFFSEKIFNKIPNRKNPGVTFSVFTNYESDFNDDYTYFLGEEVMSLKPAEGLEQLIIPAQTYTQFTAGPGQMPQVVIDMWQKIWRMSSGILGGERAYIADFEIYDERSKNPKQAIVDIYIGVK